MSALRNRRLWLICISGWVLLGCVEGVALHFDALRAERASDLAVLLAERLIADSIWVPVCAIVFVLMTRAMAQRWTSRRLVWSFAALGILLAPLYTASNSVAYALLHGGDAASILPRFLRLAMTTFMWDVVIYGLLTLGCYAALISQRARRQEREQAQLRTRLAQAELELLRAQLEPHFLFNALNTVAGLIRAQQPELATNALARLSELLRYVIEASRQDRVPLAWELQFVRNYLRLQQLRFGARLNFEIHEQAYAGGCDIPPLLLQPLIENAVVHGAARSSGTTRVDVRVGVGAAGLCVEVDNTRDVRAVAHGDGTGLGLRNTRQRLERLYGSAFQLDAGPDGPERYRVRISLPRVA